MQTADRRVAIFQPELLGAVFAQIWSWDLDSKRALAATSKAWHAAAWAAQDAAGGHRLRVMRCSEGPAGAATLQCLADFLVWRRPRVAELWLCLDPCWGRDAPEPSPGDRARVRGLACAVLALLSDQPFKLVLHSHLGADWMPRLPHVKDAAVQVYETDTDPSFDWVVDRLPRVERLNLRHSSYESRGWLSASAPLPPLLRRLRVTGYLPGIQRAFAQLDSLSIDMLLRENNVAGPIPSSLMRAIAEATRLTELSLGCPYPEDDGFFKHLAAATQLRSLELSHGVTDEESFTHENEEAEAMLSLALSPHTALTALDLSGVCQDSVPWSVGAMSALQKLDVGFSAGVTDLPAGPFRRSLTELHSDWWLAEAAVRAGPGHALWDLPRLRVLHPWGMGHATEDDKAAFRAAAAERLPGLRVML